MKPLCQTEVLVAGGGSRRPLSAICEPREQP
jgi:hypothetical protein